MYNDLENLLNEDIKFAKKNIKSVDSDEQDYDGYESKILKSDKSASMLDFLRMLENVIKLTMSHLKVEFIPEEGKVIYLANDQPLDHPLITYKVLDRKASRKEIKPRHREAFVENDYHSDRIVEIYGQRFGCHLQFNVFASTYVIAETIMEEFEKMMLTYAGYFKKNGVGEIVFDRQFTDDNFETVRQTLSIRNFSYFIEIEKITVIMRETIKEIDIIT